MRRGIFLAPQEATVSDQPQHAPVPIEDQRYRMNTVATFPSEAERQAAHLKTVHSWPHIRPNSVYVAAMGNHWAPGSWARVIDMVLKTNELGIPCWMQEMQDRNFSPYDALGTMRNEAATEAQMYGFEWICYVDNDIYPEPDTLARLIAVADEWGVPIIAPYITEPEVGRPLHGAPLQEGQGLKPVKWCVLSMLIFRTSIFRTFNGAFWQDAIGADEGYHAKKLHLYGYRQYIDTNTRCYVSPGKNARPTYPLSLNRLPADERRAWMDAKIKNLQEPPNRGPLDPYDAQRRGVLINGEYLPFMAQAPTAGPGAPADVPPVPQSVDLGAILGGAGTHEDGETSGESAKETPGADTSASVEAQTT